MQAIQVCDLPEVSLLSRYRDSGAYTDCYVTEIDRAVFLSQFVEAFYTTRLFKLEGLILKWAVSKPSTDEDAQALAKAETDRFAAWDVEARQDDQILLRDYRGRTRSWLMCESVSGTGQAGTRLFFGSAFVPTRQTGSDIRRLGIPFYALLPLHRLYSRALLSSAVSRLSRPSA